MLKSKYNYKDFIEIYLCFLNAENNTQTKKYYHLLYEDLSQFFGVFIADYIRDLDKRCYEIVDELTVEYFSTIDVLKNYPFGVTGVIEDLNKKFNPTFTKDTIKRKKLLFDMIYFLYCKLYGSSKKTITHQQLVHNNPDLFLFETELNEGLRAIYTSREQKNQDEWSLFYYKEDLNKEGYSCFLPDEIGHVIKIGSYQIKAISANGIAYCIKPI
jgi:hypothetical protein